MSLSKHEEFLRELRAPVKLYRWTQLQKRRKKGSGSQQEGASPDRSAEFDADGPEDLISLEALLEAKFDALFSKPDEG